MYIYKSMDDGIPVDEESEKGDNMRIIEIDGKPTSTVGIRYTSSDTGAAGTERTKSGRFVDAGRPDETQTEYWADIPSGFLGGQRFRTVSREDLAVSTWHFLQLLSPWRLLRMKLVHARP